MTIELLKRMMDACYQAKRIRDMLPPLPEGVTSSYIQYLDIIEKMQHQGMRVKISDISDRLSLPRPGVTRTVKEMEQKGYLKKSTSPKDGRITYLTLTRPDRHFPRSIIRNVFPFWLIIQKRFPKKMRNA